MEHALERYLRRQSHTYETALQELKQGEKKSCWMWFIFPQLRGLARSRKSFVYGIRDLDEAKAYLAHPVLGPRLIECCEAVLEHSDRSAEEIFGELDAVKLCSSMTLFSLVCNEGSIFHNVLDRFFGGQRDRLTVGITDGSIIDITHRQYIVGVEIY